MGLLGSVYIQSIRSDQVLSYIVKAHDKIRNMSIHALRLISLLILLASCAMASGSALDLEKRYSVISDKSFEDVLEDLRFAITEQNFRITSLNRIGQAIAVR